jgi:hypothetical protein
MKALKPLNNYKALLKIIVTTNCFKIHKNELFCETLNEK